MVNDDKKYFDNKDLTMESLASSSDFDKIKSSSLVLFPTLCTDTFWRRVSLKSNI
jgi:hypothetical protein